MSQYSSYVQEVQTSGNVSPEEMERAQHLYEDILLQSDSSRVTGRIARTYAEALLAAANQLGQTQQIDEQLRSLGKEVFPNVPGLEAFLSSAAVNKKAKDEAILKAFDGRATPLFVDLLRVLNHKDRIGMLRLIAIAYRTLREQEMNLQRVLVESAAPLTDEQKQALTETLAGILKKTPILVVRVEPELIGGLIVHIGDKLHDTSVRTRLRNIRNQLLARGSHEIQSGRNRFSY